MIRRATDYDALSNRELSELLKERFGNKYALEVYSANRETVIALLMIDGNELPEKIEIIFMPISEG